MAEIVWTAKKVEEIMQIAQDVISLDTPVLAEDGEKTSSLGDFIEDVDPSPLDLMILQERKERIDFYLREFLTQREYEIIKMRYGFNDSKTMTLEECGEKLKLTRERVRQIEAKALRKLRARFARNKITRETI